MINNDVKIYDSSHNLLNTVNLSLDSGFEMKSLYLPTDKLFNSDSKIEFMIKFRQTSSPYQTNYILFNEDGTNLFNFNNTSDFKLFAAPNNNYKILFSQSTSNSDEIVYQVYNLSGTLSTEQQDLLNESVTQFPNPTSEVLNINIKNLKNDVKNNVLTIYTTHGKKVLTQNINRGSEKISINISSLSRGVYIYKIGKHSSKFIKR